ncbi:ADP-ribosylglycohydrolase [Methanobrevibacter sp. YE315]|uniref:ADP-ribosylglycohydrolase family protein n=1 Tax=Methanobrevibacter sp. YE315 TaxID=1609968 RepID=UPI000764DC2C|nr:ADP-ribosylglycohydrolase family protein [Methanobrevibacter sp. YE315]AMD17222.1 ADP-ribosylglycohydrolase [Methanobrevibacter sp. YE315]
MKVKDGICGFVIGDALGVPVEFTRKEELDKDPVTGMREYGTYNQPAGTWSDDTSMTLATMESIVNKKAIDYDDMMGEFLEWYLNDKYTQNGLFDIGITTSSALENYHYHDTPALESGLSGERDNGNGSLMRILPLAYMKNIDYETIEKVSALTHAHERSRIACVLYVEIAKSILENDLEIQEHIANSCEKIKEYYKDSSELEHFERIFNDDLDYVESSGYVIKTLECVIHCMQTTSNYRDAVLKAVNLGRDTDTVGAICGGLAGIYYGYDEIPIDWLNKIYKLEEVLDLCEKYEAFCDES